MNLADATALCRRKENLPGNEIPSLVEALLGQEGGSEAKKEFLLALTAKGETAEELAGFAAAILPLAKDPGFHGDWEGKPILDCCGTGGGGLNIINFSTALMFVLAGAGVPVVKHGNRGLTKTSGSADALEALGINIDLPPFRLRESLEKTGMAFVFAPSYHSSFKAVAAVRKAIAAEGKRTIFNLIAPLLNPVRPSAQLTGIFRAEYLSLFAAALRLLGRPRFRVIYGETAGGIPLGEAAAAGISEWIDESGKTSRETRTVPGTDPGVDSLLVQSSKDSAEKIVGLMENRGTPLASAMLRLNAAHCFCACGRAESMEEGLALADESIVSGSALSRLRAWQSL